MPLIRGSNPVWSYVDLTGKQFDDTFYMFVLENDLPYFPETVWHDPSGNVPWTQPIQFLANGTLPIDIYWDDSIVYRLEFRQGPTQADPLIYPVINYVPGSGGNTPSDDVSFSTDNQITNSQFSLINFSSPLVQTSITDPDPIVIGPGWTLNLTGTGNVTLTQVPLNNSASTVNPTNAPYALEITLSGTWTSAKLIQQFDQNGMLWANKVISSSITAKIEGAPQSISAFLVDSNNTTLGEVLAETDINGTFNEYTGHALLPATSNPDMPPSAYIQYQLILPTSVDIYLSSFQLVAGDLGIEYEYAQDTIERQIDHTYHNAYPIVPVGESIIFRGFALPAHFLWENGAAYNRIIYNLLFQALTKLETVTLTATVNTFTVVDSTDYRIGMAIEGQGIPASTTISNKSGTTITMSAPASLSGSFSVRFFGYGAGNGSTTFNVPDTRDYVTAGSGGSLFGAANNGTGFKGGAPTNTMTEAQLFPHNHPGSTVNIDIDAASATGPGTRAVVNSNSKSVAVASQGGGQPFPIVQQTILSKTCIRFE